MKQFPKQKLNPLTFQKLVPVSKIKDSLLIQNFNPKALGLLNKQSDRKIVNE
jgi:hypothetical protein